MNLNNLIENLLSARRIAIVGISDDPYKPSYSIARYLIGAGYDVVPVNPNLATVLDRSCYRGLKDVPGPVDLVNIFRRPEFIPAVVAEAIEINAGGVWVQSGIHSRDGATAATAAGIDYIEDRCVMVEHARRNRQ